jgi:ADP-heptose:LPS heptosyltransferase
MFRTYRKLNEHQIREIKKILIIQQKPFGDILLNTGYLPELKRYFPEAQIDYLIQRPYVIILEDNPHLDNLIIMEKPKGRGLNYILPQVKAAISVRKRKYDLVIDQLRGTSSARIVMFSGAKYRLGWIKKRWNFLFNIQIPQAEIRYKSYYKFDLLTPLGIQVKNHNIEYKVKKESIDTIKTWIHSVGLKDETIVVFSPGSPVKRKQWDLDGYAELGDKIHNHTDFKIILLWGPNEKKDSEYILAKMDTRAIMAPPTTFNEAGALLNFAKVLITNDGGINHLAVSQNTPAISIFGPISNPLKWCAWHRKEYLYLKDWDFIDREDSSFNISPDQVFDKFHELLEVLADDNSANTAKAF